MTLSDHDYSTSHGETSSISTTKTLQTAHDTQTDHQFAYETFLDEFDWNSLDTSSAKTSSHHINSDEHLASNVTSVVVVDANPHSILPAIASSSKPSGIRIEQNDNSNKHLQLIKKINANTSTTVVSKSAAITAPSQDQQVLKCQRVVMLLFCCSNYIRLNY